VELHKGAPRNIVTVLTTTMAVCEKCGGAHFKRLCRQPYKGKSQPKFNNRPKNDNVPNKK
jgi:hypothetical protein